MPTYSYRCTACDHAFDIHQAFTDESLTVCPNCGGALRKIFAPVGVTFSGSGFYRTDSRSKPAGSGASTSADSGSGATKKESAAPAAASTASNASTASKD